MKIRNYHSLTDAEFNKLIIDFGRRTVEQLESDYWQAVEFPTHLVQTCFNLRKKTISEFSIEDLRVMIGQEIGLLYLIPFAILKLKEDLFVQGDLFLGDLLKVVFEVNEEFWKNNKALWERMNDLVKDRLEEIKNKKISSIKFLFKDHD
jgi:hypothetical protein